jgi:hypothetical protein
MDVWTLATSVLPGSAAELARLRRSEIALAGTEPRPMTVVVGGFSPASGASTLTALVARAMAGLAPGRVAVLDADGVRQTQRQRLGAPGGGDMRHLLATPEAWRSRRVVDRFLAPARVPLLAVAPDGSRSIPLDQVDLALRLLRRRFPIVIVDLPLSDEWHYEWTVRTADRVVGIGAPGPAYTVYQWFTARRSGVQVVSNFPRDNELSGPGVARLTRLQPRTLAAVEEIVQRLFVERTVS